MTQKHQSITAAAIRALSAECHIHFRRDQPWGKQGPLPYAAPHVQSDPELGGVLALRGMGDGLSMRLRYSDDALHASLMPDVAQERLLFELLEQLRVEAIAPDSLPGVRGNLQQHFQRWSLQYVGSGLTETSVGLLVFALAQMVWSYLNGIQLPEDLGEILESTRAGISPLIGDDLKGLKRNVYDQQAYAQHALTISRSLYELIESEQGATPKTGSQRSILITKRLLQLLNISNDEADEAPFASADSGDVRQFERERSHYRVFRRDYDRQAPIAKLVRPALLHELRQKLDQQVQASGLNVATLTRRLQQVFARPRRDGWDFALPEGQVDAKRLAGLITSPMQQDIFRQEARPLRTHASVTFLLDCSGSMKRHALSLALLLDTFGRAFHRADIGFEVLGFSTNSWNGGRVIKDWRRLGKPENPGRLNERLHIVLRDFEQPWSRARQGLAGLLKTDYYREGFDGEALEWAAGRLLQQNNERRLLVVISDGCPMDGATAQNNKDFYLDHHLQRVIARLEQGGEIELYALGVGLDLSPYYSRHLAIDLEQGVSNVLLREIVGLW